jgi:hypothetical protein
VIRVKEVERLTLRASAERSAALAIEAIAMHPVVDSRRSPNASSPATWIASRVHGPVRLTRTSSQRRRGLTR